MSLLPTRSLSVPRQPTPSTPLGLQHMPSLGGGSLKSSSSMSLSGAADLGVCETLFVPPEELLFGLPPVLKFARLTDPEVDRLSSQYKCVCCLLLS